MTRKYTKLTLAQKQEMLKKFAKGTYAYKLCEEYGISHGTFKYIRQHVKVDLDDGRGPQLLADVKGARGFTPIHKPTIEPPVVNLADMEIKSAYDFKEPEKSNAPRYATNEILENLHAENTLLKNILQNVPQKALIRAIMKLYTTEELFAQLLK